MKKIYFILITTCFTQHLAIQAMDLQRNKNVTSLSSLSRDVKLVITRLVADDEEKKIAAKNLAALGSIDREFNTLYGQVMESHPILYKTGFSYSHNWPLSIGNVKAEFEKAQRLNDVSRIKECTDFINKHHNKILTPSWGYFAIKPFMKDAECDTLAGQIIQDKLPKTKEIDRIKFKRELFIEINKRKEVCNFCKIASVMNVLFVLWWWTIFCPPRYYHSLAE